MRGSYQTQNNTNPWPKIILGLAVVIFVVLIVKFIMGQGPSLDEAAVSLRLTDATSTATITASDNDSKDVSANTPLASMDLVEVRNGTGQIAFLSNQKNTLNMNTATKLRYLGETPEGKSQFRLENKDLWVQSDTATVTLDLVGVALTPSSMTVMNISKNELFTTITVFQGSATLNLNGSQLEIVAGKQLNYSALKTLTIEDLTTRLTAINPDSLTSDWMKLNNAASYIIATTTTTTPSTTTSGVNAGLILFDSPTDESTVE
jgi:hypothetical protein